MKERAICKASGIKSSKNAVEIDFSKSQTTFFKTIYINVFVVDFIKIVLNLNRIIWRYEKYSFNP